MKNVVSKQRRYFFPHTVQDSEFRRTNEMAKSKNNALFHSNWGILDIVQQFKYRLLK